MQADKPCHVERVCICAFLCIQRKSVCVCVCVCVRERERVNCMQGSAYNVPV